jgi:hypothetical protein
MKIITYHAFGKEMKQYTVFSLEDISFAIKIICPTAHSVIIRQATEKELRLLSCPILIYEKRTVTNSRRTILRKLHVKKKLRKKNTTFDYKRTKQIFFFEDDVKVLLGHMPELECLFFVS